MSVILSTRVSEVIAKLFKDKAEKEKQTPSERLMRLIARDVGAVIVETGEEL